MKEKLSQGWRWFWKEVWIFHDIWFDFTGTRIQAPIEIFFPNYCEWVFVQMSGTKGEKIEEDQDGK